TCNHHPTRSPDTGPPAPPFRAPWTPLAKSMPRLRPRRTTPPITAITNFTIHQNGLDGLSKPNEVRTPRTRSQRRHPFWRHRRRRIHLLRNRKKHGILTCSQTTCEKLGDSQRRSPNAKASGKG